MGSLSSMVMVGVVLPGRKISKTTKKPQKRGEETIYSLSESEYRPGEETRTHSTTSAFPEEKRRERHPMFSVLEREGGTN